MNLKPYIEILNFETFSGGKYPKLPLQYQVFGPELGTAPLVVINHALTGNSQVTGENGWWNEAVGVGKPIDTERYTVLTFDIPGNGYQNTFRIENPKEWIARDVARLFLLGLEKLKIERVFALVGNSVGGGIAWEMVALAPELFGHLIAVSTDWKSSDWIIANSLIQERILESSANALHDARLHAMLCYRSPRSFKMKFERSFNPEKLPLRNVETWLLHHGEKLKQRFTLSAYKLMNQLVKTIDISAGRISFENAMQQVQTEIHIIGTNSDLYFVPEENRQTYAILQKMGKKATYHEIDSVHGHDAFLIEYQQLDKILRKII
ncbi:homoserine O-acetyltransferase [Capnocytophaga stomatis]|uniref:alpha/beta fold hydrolase n=1 Tax=Capnocytophaga stomatis TaxID=1848904 RepID=UPI00194DC94A|nr:alpha/beta fold hydrolase [Capnocytophaga stomatis]GIJ95675.1 homoserine O-acetyltransferase [Capnocytophaga stomatis]